MAERLLKTANYWAEQLLPSATTCIRTMTDPVAIGSAARALNISAGTLRRWIAQGAPVARRGGRGRGRSTLVEVAALSAWRRSNAEDYPRILAGEVSEILAAAMYEAFVAIEGPHKRAAAGMLAGAWYLATSALLDRLRRDAPDIPELRAVPEKILTLRSIFDGSGRLRAS